MNFFKKAVSLFLIITKASTLFCIDNHHFYKAPYLNATKSWNNKDWLAIFDAHYAHGSTHRSRNNNGNRANTFDLYGNHNILYLTTNVPRPAGISAMLEGYIDALETTRTAFEAANPTDKQCFGQVGFCSECKVDEFVFTYRQNLISNFFAELTIPIRRIKTGPMTIVDKTPVGSSNNPDYTQQDTTWTNVRDNLDDILKAYGFDGYACSSKTTNFGDITFLVGWQRRLSYKTDFFEYIDFGIKGGILFPTGAPRKYQKPFSLETGYNNHWGFPVRTDAVFGLSKDIYVGTYLGFVPFSSKTHSDFPVKTNENQNGFIKLYRTKIHEKKGTLFDTGIYLTLDHFLKGFSMLVGYSYNHQAGDTLAIPKGCECEYTNNVIMNSDCRLKKWRMHVLHALAEYDFGAHDYFKNRSWQPRVSLFYDYPFSGKRIFVTAMLGGAIGCNVSWNF